MCEQLKTFEILAGMVTCMGVKTLTLHQRTLFGNFSLYSLTIELKGLNLGQKLVEIDLMQISLLSWRKAALIFTTKYRK